VAAALVHGNGGVAAFDAQSLTDPRIARLRDITRLVPFPEVRPAPEDRPSRVIVTDRHGARAEAVCWSAQGGPDRPYSEDALWAKLQELCAPHAPGLVPTMRALVLAVQSPDGGQAIARPWRDALGELFLARGAVAGAPS
jgi:2-methylcitrate dehydratase PrpD